LEAVRLPKIENSDKTVPNRLQDSASPQHSVGAGFLQQLNVCSLEAIVFESELSYAIALIGTGQSERGKSLGNRWVSGGAGFGQ
jgi:hypothetical protein